ncbi:MAG: hypothetical protein GY861_15000 [bacterium]|nr:hypothetical protein [bacterium]
MIISLSEKQYRDMDKTHIFATMLKTLHSESARHLGKKKEGSSLSFGTIAHCFFLEPKRFEHDYIVIPDLPDFKPVSDKTKKDYAPGGKGKNYQLTKEWKEQRVNHLAKDGFFEEDGKLLHKTREVVTQSDMEALNSMKANAEKDFPILFSKYLTGGKAEYSIVNDNMKYVKGDGKVLHVPAKCRLDYVIEFEDYVCVVDVKTCQSAHPRAFKYDMLKYGYDVQEAWYTDMAQQHFNKPAYFIFFAVENQFPYNAAFYDTRSEQKSGYAWGKEKIDSVIEEAFDVIQGMPKKGYVKPDTIVSI